MSGVQFETLVAPVCATEKPKTGSFVTYHYICRDESGNRIDSTYDENAPIHAKIGSGNIIQVRFKLRSPETTDSEPSMVRSFVRNYPNFEKTVSVGPRQRTDVLVWNISKPIVPEGPETTTFDNFQT